MNIIAGCARNLLLADLPDSEVRPTAGRARKALFDSLGPFDNTGVLDLCSGSGALALEAVSRGAAWAAMVEKDPAHIGCIKENCRRINAAGAKGEMLILEFDVLNFERYRSQLPAAPDVIFADPPYAVSAEIFHSLMKNRSFLSFCGGAKLIWEIPDSPGAMGNFINFPQLHTPQFRRFGSTIFLSGTLQLENI